MPFVLIIGERSNSWAGRTPAISLHHSREQAQAGLLEYVKRNWKDEIGEELNEESEDPDELIEQYFDEVLEFYDIQEVQYSTPGPPIAESA